MINEFLFFAIQLSVLSFVQLVPLNKPSSQQNAVVMAVNEQDGLIYAEDIRSQIRNSVQSIAGFAVSVNGSDLILQKDTPKETIVISTKIPSIVEITPINPEKEIICEKEGSFDVKLNRGNENLFTFLCLTETFFDEKTAFSLDIIRTDQLFRPSSLNTALDNLSRFNPLTISVVRIRKILKDKEITSDLVKHMLNVANLATPSVN